VAPHSRAMDPRTRNPRVAFVNFLYRNEKRRREDAVLLLLTSGYTLATASSRCQWMLSWKNRSVAPRPGLEPGTCGL